MLGNSDLRGASLFIGPAGSGKTTALRQRHADLVRAGEQGVLFLVHSRRAARALAGQIVRDVAGPTDQVRVTTWHAYALSLLRAHYRRLGYMREPSLLTGPEQFALVREMVTAPEEQEHWHAFRKHLRLKGFVEELREFVLRAQDALESPESLEERARLARRDDLAEAARFFRRYLDNIDAQSLVDHANVIALAVRLVQEHEDIAAEVRADTRHLLVDDYQDVTPAQETLLRLLFVDGGSVTAAANPDARIFGFRGASPAALDTFRKDFAPVRETTLDIVHRGTPRADAWCFDHLTEEAEAIARECRRLHARDATPWGEIAIVVRRYSSSWRAIRRSLERASVPYVVVGENRPLVNEPALIPMLELARAALRVDEREERLPKILASPVVGLDPYEVRALLREARLRQTSLAGLLAAPPDDLPDRVRGALVELNALLGEVADRDLREARPDAVFWFLWERLPLFRDMVERGDDADLDAVAAFARAVERFSDRRPGKRFGDYLDVLEGVEFGP
ncbi:MAG TPA: ATP-dependent helicase, partial [Actinomycetota bacterium]|nr:ATP-dependent helicase [Actinomycetota bacterium]